MVPIRTYGSTLTTNGVEESSDSDGRPSIMARRMVDGQTSWCRYPLTPHEAILAATLSILASRNDQKGRWRHV
jgi:hypothetical protein